MRPSQGHLEERERRFVVVAFLLFFCLMAGYAILKPLRDQLAIVATVKRASLAVMFTWTFGAMVAAIPVYSALVARAPRRRVIPLVYGFFLTHLLAFFVLMRWQVAPVAVANVFYVWVSVYNLFVVSVFWSLMADLFTPEQGRRRFGLIAAGGTAGALCGFALTAATAARLGPLNLLLVSAALLASSLVAVRVLSRFGHALAVAEPRAASHAEGAVGGGAFTGFFLVMRSPYLLALGAQTLLFSVLSTFLYFHQQRLVATAAKGAGQQTALFATIDLAAQGLTLILQFVVTGPLLKRLGLGVSLALVPIVTALGFFGLAFLPSLGLFIGFRALRSATHYALERPSREVLFTSVNREEKYKAKSFIDTALYRGSDLAGGWLYTGLGALGLGVSGVSLLAVPFCVSGVALAGFLARRQRLQGASA